MSRMRVIVRQEDDGGTAVLTDEHEAALPGWPLLVIDAADVRGVFRPRDLITGPAGELVSAASVIVGWASEADRTAEDVAAAYAFLKQLSARPAGEE